MLSKMNRVTLQWVLGLKSNYCNKKADKMTMEGSVIKLVWIWICVRNLKLQVKASHHQVDYLKTPEELERCRRHVHSKISHLPHQKHCKTQMTGERVLYHNTLVLQGLGISKCRLWGVIINWIISKHQKIYNGI